MPGIDFSQNSSALSIPLDTYMRILGMAVTQIHEDLGSVRKALNQGEQATVQEYSHRWKGDLANLRMEQLAQTAGELNGAVKRMASVEEQTKHLDAFERQFRELQKEIQGKQ